MLEIKNLTKEYIVNKKTGIKVVALDQVNLKFGETGLTAIVGKSGSGKTTLLNMLGGIDDPTSGAVIRNGKSLSAYTSAEYDEYRNFGTGFIFQDYNLLNDYSVIDNIKLAVKLQEDDKAIIDERAMTALEQVGLSELANRKINTLSGGQQQRIAIARAFAKESEMILCDEPTGNLDSKTSFEIFEILKTIAKERSVIVVTHDEELASKFADRLIRLRDGQVAEDFLITANEEAEPKEEEESKETKKKVHRGISVKDSLLMIKDNFFHAKISSFIVLVLLVAALSLTTVFSSLSGYDSEDALLNTLRANKQNVFQLTKYKDEPVTYYDDETGEAFTFNGPDVWYENCKEEDIPGLYEAVDGKANFYPAYFFNKIFQDFTDEFLFDALGRTTKIPYELYGFREAVSVHDFSTFYMELSYGKVPNSGNEILIYDYMAYCMIYYGLLEGEIRDAIGKELTDKQTGLTIKISGILKSDYTRYAYLKERKSGKNYDFEESYLSSLQTVFCKPDLIVELKKEKDYSPVFRSYFMNDETEEIFETNIKKLKIISIENITFLAGLDDYSLQRGFIVNKSTVAKILGIEDVDDVTPEVAENFMLNYRAGWLEIMVGYTFAKSLVGLGGDAIIGITDDFEDEEGVLYWYFWDGDSEQTSDIRSIYISLGNNWKINREVLSHFVWEEHDEAFYVANPDYYIEGYTHYTAYGVLIRNANYYLEDVKYFAQYILWVMIAATVLGIFFFTVMTVKKYRYKIGVLKALGAKNMDILSIFGIQVILLALISFALSIPVSFVLMGEVNKTFAESVNSDLVFFAVQATSALIVFVASMLAVIVSALVPLVRLYLAAPMSVIRNNGKK